jgi:hypothetical protein
LLQREGYLSHSHGFVVVTYVMRSAIMLGDDEDVFDSVTWEESPTPEIDEPSTSHGPGFIQSTTGANEDPLQPKWEGYLMTSVRDPVKELAETKDAYVSYLVSAKVRLPSRVTLLSGYSFTTDQPSHILYAKPVVSSSFSRLRLSQRPSCSRLPSLCCSCVAR